MVKKTLPKLIDECARKMQLLVRLKAADDNGWCKCVSCGAVGHYKDMQGGHYIPRGNSATKLLEENIHPQCPGCNGFGMKYGNAEKHYTIYMIEMYGRKFVDDLLHEARARKPVKRSRAEIEQLIKEANEQIKYHKKRVGE